MIIKNEKPLVTVICICYNQAKFIEESLESVINQTYPCIQLIIADDFSTDGSNEIITDFLKKGFDALYIPNKTNVGNCKTFNHALTFAKGEYIIDLAGDDILLDDRIEKQVTLFEELPEDYGVIFSDSFHINESGKIIGKHYKKVNNIPSGNVYESVLKSFFISPPTMIIKKVVLDYLQGYDENLAYEDFDFWVRSSRKWKYFFQNEITTKKRMVTGSLSSKFYDRRQHELLKSTYLVCEKAFKLNRNEEENKALIQRIKYELKHCYLTEHFELVINYQELLKQLNYLDTKIRFLFWLSEKKIRIWRIYSIYLNLIKFKNNMFFKEKVVIIYN